MGLSRDDPLQGLDGGDDGEPDEEAFKKELWPDQATLRKKSSGDLRSCWHIGTCR